MAQQQPARRKMQSSKTPVSIPDKLYFRIGDVSRLCSLPAYVLRFWETEFPQLKPNKGGTGQRLYRKRDVEMVLEIKRLLYGEGFTIAGARRLLAENRRAASRPVSEISDHPSRNATRVAAGKQVPTPVTTAPSPRTRPTRPPLAASSEPSSPPRLKDLRKEMREILSLLGSDRADRDTTPSPVKRDARKTRSKTSDEPTLF